MAKLKIGFVGMEFIADFHYDGFAETNAELIGMTQDFYEDDEKVMSMKKKLIDKCSNWNVKPYDNFDEMVNDAEIDALMIASVNTYHYE